MALNYCMRDAGGFEGNGQTLRLLTRLENFSAKAGANLSRRAMLGVLKYPASLSALLNPAIRPQLQAEPSVLQAIDLPASTPPKGYLDCEADVVDWILDPLRESDKARFTVIERRAGRHARTLHKSLDCSIMDLADDIAYGVHDLEDAIALRLMTQEQFRAQVTGWGRCSTGCERCAFLQVRPGTYSNNADIFGVDPTSSPSLGFGVITLVSKEMWRCNILRCCMTLSDKSWTSRSVLGRTTLDADHVPLCVSVASFSAHQSQTASAAFLGAEARLRTR